MNSFLKLLVMRRQEGRKKQKLMYSENIQQLVLSEVKKGSLFTAVSIQTCTTHFCLKQVTKALLVLLYHTRKNTSLKRFVNASNQTQEDYVELNHRTGNEAKSFAVRKTQSNVLL